MKSASTVAKLLFLNSHLYSEDRERGITRFRISSQTLKKISGRINIHERFIDALQEVFFDFGWLLIKLDGEYALLDLTQCSNWVKIGSKRLSESCSSIKENLSSEAIINADPEIVDELFESVFPELISVTDD